MGAYLLIMDNNMHRSMFALGFTLAACSAGHSEEPMTLEQRTAEIARLMNTVAPKELGNGLTLISVSSEGKTLVMSLKGLVEWRPSVSDAEVAKILGASLCENRNIQAAVRNGALFRIDGLTVEGKRLPPLYVCSGQ
ncbi:hypothetical protein ASG11_01240 [Sphingomonas sp. Leaf357]|nr:hypothetical protein ASG11_01240 [Sphingomonas sp. Leaf357]